MCKGITFSGSPLLHRGELFRSFCRRVPMFTVAFLVKKGDPPSPPPSPPRHPSWWNQLPSTLFCRDASSSDPGARSTTRIVHAVSSPSSLLHQHLAEGAGLTLIESCYSSSSAWQCSVPPSRVFSWLPAAITRDLPAIWITLPTI